MRIDRTELLVVIGGCLILALIVLAPALLKSVGWIDAGLQINEDNADLWLEYGILAALILVVLFLLIRAALRG